MNRLAASFIAIAAAAIACSDDPENPASNPDASTTSTDAEFSDSGDSTVTIDAGNDAGVDGGLVEIDTPITDRFRAIAESFESERAANGAPSAALLILENGEITFAHGFGTKDPAGGDPVQSTTLFRIGSVNKMLTSAALMQHVAEGAVELDDPVTTPIPALSFTRDAAWAPSITLRHLLTHSAAIVDYIPLEVPEEEMTDESLDTFLTGEFEEIAYLLAPPGVMWNYSNPGYAIAGLAVEKLSGVIYRDAMRDRLFAPLGMNRTFFDPQDVIDDGDYAKGLSSDALGRRVTIEPEMYDNGWLRPCGYAFSSVRDLAQFVLFLAQGNNAVMPDAVREQMFAKQIDMKTRFDIQSYGLGLFVSTGLTIGQDFHRTPVISHGGNIPGFTADVFYVPELRFGYIVLAARDLAYFRGTLALALRTLTTLPAAEPLPPFEVDPAEFTRFAGSYLDEYNFGPIEVTAHTSSISVLFPELDKAQIPYRKELMPISPENFIWSVQGQNLQVTFIAGENGSPAYFRTRSGVGKRVTTARLGAPHTRFDRERFLRSLRVPADEAGIYLPAP